MKTSTKYYIVGGLIAAGLLLSFTTFGATRTPKPATRNPEPILVTDYDSAYDYKYENGRWYTHNKGQTEWRDMQSILSAENYALAVGRLTQHLASQGIEV